jgi:hypothetical protein
VNNPKPALVTLRGARRLPRLALLLLCAAYVLPGLVGRDPWRGAESVAFGQMMAIAEGRTSWWQPLLGGVPGDTALLNHWLGAVFIQAGAGWLDPVLAARLPFALLLGLTLALVWYTTFHLARTDAAQPLPFAFGGEANPVDYARAIADGALLALLATLGLLLPGHETTPELLQLTATAMYLYGLAAAPYRPWQARAAVLCALPLLAGSGAPSMALAMGLGGLLVCSQSRYEQVRAFVVWLIAALLAAGLLAWGLGAWRWRALPLTVAELPLIARQWLWFMWPAWPLALYTLWRWRRQLSYRHMSVPLATVLVALGANLAMDGSDRALMLGLPGLAVLAAFALPTLKRSASAAIDWFSMFFFTAVALWFWLVYVAMQSGWPVWQARNVAKLVPGFAQQFSLLPFLLAVGGTVAWVALVRWRTGRHPEALWKSLVLPAGGVALCWLLAMSLWLPPLDYARSARPLIDKLTPHVKASSCVAAPGLLPSTVAALEYQGRWRVDARPGPPAAACDTWLQVSRRRGADTLAGAPPQGWLLVAEVRRPSDRDEVTSVYRRTQP